MAAARTPAEIEDLLWDAIGNSFDVDWTARDGAKAIVRELADEGLCIVPTAALDTLRALIPPAQDAFTYSRAIWSALTAEELREAQCDLSDKIALAQSFTAQS